MEEMVRGSDADLSPSVMSFAVLMDDMVVSCVYPLSFPYVCSSTCPLVNTLLLVFRELLSNKTMSYGKRTIKKPEHSTGLCYQYKSID